MNHRSTDEYDKLRAEFTAWLDTLIRRAKLNYIQKEKRQLETISLDNLPDIDEIAYHDSETLRITIQIDDFEFEEERLANAYAELPLMRRQILKMLFVDEMKPGEIAKRLNCSPEYVSHQRYKGLRYLRKKMTEGGDENGQG